PSSATPRACGCCTQRGTARGRSRGHCCERGSDMTSTAQRLRVAEGKGERAPVPDRTVPAMQTAWPHMLLPRPAAVTPLVFPFQEPGLRYRYFCRNAVWDAVSLLQLEGKRVLMPAYHHGVELETLLAAG